MLIFFSIYAQHVGSDKAGLRMLLDPELGMDSLKETNK
jgi:hypothetical protein